MLVDRYSFVLCHGGYLVSWSARRLQSKRNGKVLRCDGVRDDFRYSTCTEVSIGLD